MRLPVGGDSGLLAPAVDERQWTVLPSTIQCTRSRRYLPSHQDLRYHIVGGVVAGTETHQVPFSKRQARRWEQ